MCLSRKILYSLMLRIPIFFKLTSLDFPVDFAIFSHWNFHKHSLHCLSLTILEDPLFFLNFQFLTYSLKSTSLKLRFAIETPTTVVICFFSSNCIAGDAFIRAIQLSKFCYFCCIVSTNYRKEGRTKYRKYYGISI